MAEVSAYEGGRQVLLASPAGQPGWSRARGSHSSLWLSRFYPEVKRRRHALSSVATRRVGGGSADQIPKISMTYGNRWDKRAHSRKNNEVPGWFVHWVNPKTLGFGSVTISMS